MLRILQRGTPVTIEIVLEAEFTDPQDGRNIVGDFPGTDLKDESFSSAGILIPGMAERVRPTMPPAWRFAWKHCAS